MFTYCNIYADLSGDDKITVNKDVLATSLIYSLQILFSSIKIRFLGGIIMIREGILGPMH